MGEQKESLENVTIRIRGIDGEHDLNSFNKDFFKPIVDDLSADTVHIIGMAKLKILYPSYDLYAAAARTIFANVLMVGLRSFRE